MKTTLKVLAAVFAFSTSAAFAGNDNSAVKNTSFRTGMYVSADGKLNLNIEKKEPAFTSVAIKDQNGAVIYETQVSKKPNTYSLKMDLSELKSGDYQVQIKNGKESETRSISITEPKLETLRKLTME